VSDLLARICADKRAEVAAAKAARPLAAVEAAAGATPPPRGFIAALEHSVMASGYGLIAESQKASPSRGLIRADFSPAVLARAYAAGGAACLSVLTDAPYFQGLPVHLEAAREMVELPILRKDFMVDPYQVPEARAMGADCILVIMAAVTDAEAQALEAAAARWQLDVLAEVHDEAELARALRLKTRLIGINNRNLNTLAIDLATTERLARDLPKGRLLVSESGLHSPADLARMARAGARCFLIGESLMKERNVEAATRAILSPMPAQQAPA
jgi:indole-3-glycerol phosphate synthase